MLQFRGVGNPFITLAEVDSTNNYAMARVSEGPVSDGTTWFALKQTAGKGQRGRPWQSAPGENILLSIVLKPLMLRPAEQFMLSASVALGVYDLVQKYAGDATKIKWSNDLYVGDKKAGGILIENVLRGNDWNYAIVGIGLNVNQVDFPPELPNPVSLGQLTGRRYDAVRLGRELCACIDERYRVLRPENFSRILTEYNSVLYHLKQERSFRMGDESFKASLQGVEKDGKLILLKEGGLLRLGFGEITFVI